MSSWAEGKVSPRCVCVRCKYELLEEEVVTDLVEYALLVTYGGIREYKTAGRTRYPYDAMF